VIAQVGPVVDDGPGGDGGASQLGGDLDLAERGQPGALAGGGDVGDRHEVRGAEERDTRRAGEGAERSRRDRARVRVAGVRATSARSSPGGGAARADATRPSTAAASSAAGAG
jgi:hypothetical protein